MIVCCRKMAQIDVYPAFVHQPDTMLGVYDQVMAVEALPPIPKMAVAANGQRLRATDTD